MARGKLGWLGPAIALLGVAAGAAGAWYMVHARPEAGPVIETVAIDARRAVVVRREVGGDRAFVELRDGDAVKWQALVPHYAGRPGAPGVAWSSIAVTVRVVRDGRAEVFALAMQDASKLGGIRLAGEHGPIAAESEGPVTLTDHLRSYEIIAGPDWHQLAAIDLHTGRLLWTRELGPAPVRAGGVSGDTVWIDQGSGPRAFAAQTGSDRPAAGKLSDLVPNLPR